MPDVRNRHCEMIGAEAGEALPAGEGDGPRAVEREEQDGLKRAYANALTKAETLALLSGGVLGKTLSASEDTNRVYPNFGGPARAMGRVVMGNQDSGVEERSFSVSVTYELR